LFELKITSQLVLCSARLVEGLILVRLILGCACRFLIARFIQLTYELQLVVAVHESLLV